MKKVIDYCKNSLRINKILRIVMLSLFAIYIFSLPYFSDRAPFNYLVYGIFALFSISVVIYRVIYSDIKAVNYRMFIPIAFFLFSSISTILFSHQFRGLLTVLLVSLSFLVFFLFLDEIKNIDLVLQISIISLSAFVLLFIIHYRDYLLAFKNWSNERLAVDNFFDNVNMIGAYLSGCAFLSLYYAFFGTKKYKLLFLIPYFICFFLGILTASRTFIVSVLAISISLFIAKFIKKPVVLIIGLVAILIAFILMFSLPSFATLRDRLNDMLNMITGNAYSTDFSTATRVLRQDYARYLGLQRLFIGNGINSFQVLSGTGTYSHANISEVFCSVGIIGLILYYSIPLISVYDSFFKNANYKLLIIGILIYLLSKEFFSVTYMSKFNALFFALISFCGYKSVPKLKKNVIKVERYFAEV